MSKTIAILGASHAATELSLSLRRFGFDGRIQVIGAESSLPYHRPPLSKAYLAGEKTLEQILLRPQKVYDNADIDMVLDAEVKAIDRRAKTLSLETGEVLNYDKLALTVGARVRYVRLPGCDLQGIFYLRNVEDANSIKRKFKSGAKLVVVGGGYIGLEVAAIAAKGGLDVTVLEMAPRVLARVTAPCVSEFFTRTHTEEGVAVRTNITVSGFEGKNHVQQVLCEDGSRYDADLVLIAVGIAPNTELAETAGLVVDNGIVVDSHACTSDPNIVAAGDCTTHPSKMYGRRVRLESVQNAVEQAKVAAATLCGKRVEYDALPWFWSDQYDIKLQIAGLSQGYDDVILRGNMDARAFSAFYLKDGVVIAIDAVNRPKEYAAGRKLIAQRAKPELRKLADTSIDIKEFLP